MLVINQLMQVKGLVIPLDICPSNPLSILHLILGYRGMAGRDTSCGLQQAGHVSPFRPGREPPYYFWDIMHPLGFLYPLFKYS